MRKENLWTAVKSFFSIHENTLFDWIQVEVTSYCNASCRYCPHTVYKDNWVSRHMPMELFEQLMPSFRNTRLVYLQGWGEPLLHPEFFAMVKMLKKNNCVVGTTTNGTTLTGTSIEQLMESGLDILAFSLAGTDKKNDEIRYGTSLDGIMKTIKTINALKEKNRTEAPAIHIAYLLLKSNKDDSIKLPTLFKDLPIKQIVLSSLDFVPDKSWENELIRTKNKDVFPEIELLVSELIESGKEDNLDINLNFPVYLKNTENTEVDTPSAFSVLEDTLYSEGSFSRTSACLENVSHSVFISADGTVSPCVFFNIPVSSATCIQDGFQKSYQRFTFGNVQNETLDEIWKSRQYHSFRNSFIKGKLWPECQQCPRFC